MLAWLIHDNVLILHCRPLIKQLSTETIQNTGGDDVAFDRVRHGDC